VSCTFKFLSFLTATEKTEGSGMNGNKQHVLYNLKIDTEETQITQNCIPVFFNDVPSRSQHIIKGRMTGR
jgi:hypothetical protein